MSECTIQAVSENGSKYYLYIGPGLNFLTAKKIWLSFIDKKCTYSKEYAEFILKNYKSLLSGFGLKGFQIIYVW